jgi:hypothetical protein
MIQPLTFKEYEYLRARPKVQKVTPVAQKITFVAQRSTSVALEDDDPNSEANNITRRMMSEAKS